MSYRIDIGSEHLSRVISTKQLKVKGGVVTYHKEPVKCRWCGWSPQPDELKGADGLLSLA